MSYKPLLLLTFFTLLFSLLYIGLKVPKGTGSIFEQRTLKNLHLVRFAPSLQNFFRRVLVCRQAEQTENEDLSCSTWTSNSTHRTANSIVLRNYLTPYLVTLSSKGLAPRFASPQPTTNPKTRGNQKRLTRVVCIVFDTVDKTATETCSIYPLNLLGG